MELRAHAALAAAVLLTLAGCPSKPDKPDAGEEDFDRLPMLASQGEHVILPTYRTFAERAAALKTALDAYVGALGGAEEAARRTEAQEAWRAASAAWQQAELMQLGPAGMGGPDGTAGARAGGEDLRDEVYSWPVVNPCRVDQELVAKEYDTPGFFEAELVNVYGLAALEYLLFFDAPDNSCAPQATINANGEWAALPAEEVKARRAGYARAAAGYLQSVAQTLVGKWEPSGGNFLGQLATAGQAGSVYDSARMAADELFAAVFYLDKEVKDLKLAVPAGLSLACMQTVCPEQLESRFAHVSKESLVANLLGFRRVLVGNDRGETERLGFDDWLRERGAGELADTVVADTDAAIAALEAIPGTLEESLARDPEELRGVYTQVKRVTDALKTQFASVLGLRVPEEGASDND